MAGKSDKISQQIIKATGIFGGVQVFSILCSIVRTKLVALWIGAAGVGLFGLYNSVIELISAVTNLGIRDSSVRNISMEMGKNEPLKIASIITVVRRWSVFLGLTGALLTLGFSPMLSLFTFGDYNHIWGFVALSAVLLFNALTNGENAILQGSSMLRRLAEASVYGTSGGLIVSIPLFYFFKEDSIVPSILAYSFFCAFFTWLFRNKQYTRQPIHMNMRETYEIGKTFVQLGILMTLSNFLSQLMSYAFMAYLNHAESTETVGYYQAGFTLVSRYCGLFLAAIGVEYYPRLAKVSESNLRVETFVAQEINMSLLILVPVAAIMILMRSVVVSLLYTSDFHVILGYLSWSMIALILRAPSWCMAFVILARGKGGLYLLVEMISSISILTLNILFYHLWGLTGLGVSFLGCYIIYILAVGAVYRLKFRLRFKRSCLLWILWGLFITSSTYVSMEMEWIAAAIAIATATTAFSLYHLRAAVK